MAVRWCATCDRSPRWGTSSQCYGCLRDQTAPADYVPKYIVERDTTQAVAAMKAFRAQWEVAHPGFRLAIDRERAWPETRPPLQSNAAKRLETGPKRYYCLFRVERA